MYRDKITEDRKETVVINSCSVKSGPGEDYQTAGNLAYGETVLLAGSYNGWFLVKTEPNGEFWIDGKNIVDYDYARKGKSYGVVTADTVGLGQIHLQEGNLVWILKKDSDRSYVRTVMIDINGGYSGWIDRIGIYHAFFVIFSKTRNFLKDFSPKTKIIHGIRGVKRQ